MRTSVKICLLALPCRKECRKGKLISETVYSLHQLGKKKKKGTQQLEHANHALLLGQGPLLAMTNNSSSNQGKNQLNGLVTTNIVVAACYYYCYYCYSLCQGAIIVIAANMKVFWSTNMAC